MIGYSHAFYVCACIIIFILDGNSPAQPTTTPGGYVVEELSDEEIAFDNEEFDMQEVSPSSLT